MLFGTQQTFTVYWPELLILINNKQSIFADKVSLIHLVLPLLVKEIGKKDQG